MSDIIKEASEALEGTTPLVGWLRNPWSKSDSVDRGPIPEWLAALLFEAAGKIEVSSDTIRVLLSRIAAQEAQIKGLEAERDSLLAGHRALNISGARLQDRAEAAETALAAMTKELETARLATGLVRLCVNCGATRPADYGMVTPRAGCPSPDACTWDMTPQEAADHWRKIAHDRYAALAAERAKVAKLVEAGKDALIVLDEFHIGPESPVIADLRAAIKAEKGE